jgi:hypothetical protein
MFFFNNLSYCRGKKRIKRMQRFSGFVTKWYSGSYNTCTPAKA